MSNIKRYLLKVPYYGTMSMLQPENGQHIAALGELTGEASLGRIRNRLLKSPKGRRLLQQKPLINTNNLNIHELLKQNENTFGWKYSNYLKHHHFNPDERSPVRYIADQELAYVMVRYRQIHDFWHVLCDLPPTILGEIALKSFEWRITGLPSCGLSTILGPLRLSLSDKSILVTTYIPWSFRSGTECEDLMMFDYEANLHRHIDDVRADLNLEPAPRLSR